MIQATGPNSFGITASGSVSLFNSGTISGGTGIFAGGAGGVGSNITTSGTIIGTGGIAIQLSAAADTLTLLSGSRIVGLIDMGGGADTINLVNNITVTSKVSSLTTLLSGTILPNVINFTGTVNASITVNNSSGLPSVLTATQLATLDPTALAQTGRALMDFTGGVSSLVQGRLGGLTPTAFGMQAASFAPEASRVADGANAAFASQALGYGSAGRSFTKAPAGSDITAPYVAWTNGFGGKRMQDGTDQTLASNTTTWGVTVGIDRKVRSDLLLGAFLGVGGGRLSVDQSSQNVDTDYVFGGAYGRFEWASQFFDFTLTGGNASNKSSRLVVSDVAAGGIETATAKYNGWFVSPEFGYGRHYSLGNGYTLTPSARVRYVAGFFDGYSESGSAQNLVVGSRKLQNVEERGVFELSRTAIFGSANTIKTSVHGGVIAQQRVGDTTINTVLIGQNLSFATPGTASPVGVVAGAGFDLRMTERVSLFGAFEGMVMSDKSRTGNAKGGLRVAF